MTDLVDVGILDTSRLPEELRQSWQGRVLAAATYRKNMEEVQARDKYGRVLLSILAHCFDDNDAWVVLLFLIHPHCKGISGEIVCTIGRIDKGGRVVADVMEPYSERKKRKKLFDTLDDYKSYLRGFADRMDFTDQERLEFFTCARRWLACDERLDPTMDRNDPDAKRLVEV